MDSLGLSSLVVGIMGLRTSREKMQAVAFTLLILGISPPFASTPEPAIRHEPTEVKAVQLPDYGFDYLSDWGTSDSWG